MTPHSVVVCPNNGEPDCACKKTSILQISILQECIKLNGIIIKKKGEYVQTAQITQTRHIRPAERKMVSMHTSVQVLLKTATVRALVTGRWSEFNTNLTL